MIARRPARFQAGVFAWFVLLVVACSVGDVDFTNKACPCGLHYVCDPNRNVCVPSATGLDSGSSTSDGGVDDGGIGTGCQGDVCPCTRDTDCPDPTRPRCSTTSVCVECLPSSDNCRAGAYCNGSNQCVLGCKQESDCQISPSAPHCDVARHQCVACRTIADCVDADQCSPSGDCVQGCDLDAGKLCPAGKTCCQELCIDTTKDPLNCGACGTACSQENSTPTCAFSQCTWTCASGFSHCGSENTGCETNIRIDALNCGSCARNCNDLVANANGIGCNSGTCTFESCSANHDNCDGQSENGCECTCGTHKAERCCPGAVCNAPLSCNQSANKCN